MIRAVVDANVLISAALARSPAAPSARILDAAMEGNLAIVTSPTLLAEVSDVLHRPRLRRYLSPDEANRFVANLAARTVLSTDAPSPHPRVCRDPGDDYLVALVIHTEADALVSGDRDLLEIGDTGVEILTPRALIERLDAG